MCGMSSHNTNNCLQRILKHYTLLIFKNKYPSFMCSMNTVE